MVEPAAGMWPDNQTGEERSSPHPEYRTWAALIGILIAIAAFNFMVRWWFPDGPLPENVHAMYLGAWVFQPMLLAMWAALAPGCFIIRFPLVVLCLLLLLEAPALRAPSFDDVQRFEFILVAIAGTVLLCAITAILFAVRWLCGWQLIHRNTSEDGPAHLQFSLRYLLLLTSLLAAVLGITSSLDFKPPDPSPFFGPDFFIFVIAVGGAVISATISPVVLIPIVLLGRSLTVSFALWSLTFWAFVTCITSVVLAAMDEPPLGLVVKYILLMQLGATTIAVPAALILRFAGYRFIRVGFLELSIKTVEA